MDCINPDKFTDKVGLVELRINVLQDLLRSVKQHAGARSSRAARRGGSCQVARILLTVSSRHLIQQRSERARYARLAELPIPTPGELAK